MAALQSIWLMWNRQAYQRCFELAITSPFEGSCSEHFNSQSVS